MNNIPEFYDDLSKRYDKQRGNRYFKLIEDIEYSIIEDEIKANSAKQILEVGCGTGIFLDRINSKDLSLFGVDISDHMLTKAKQKSPDQDFNLVNADAQYGPFRDDSFDLIFSLKVLAHIYDLNKALEEINRMLKPGSIAILEFYNKYSFKRIFTRNRYFHVWHSPKEAFDIVSNNNFKVIQIRGARIITPFSFLMDVPFLKSSLYRLEKYLSKTRLANLAGYFIMVCRKM